MDQPEPLPREPSLNELCCLSASANIVYAVRCGRRVQPKYRPIHEDAAKMATIVDSSLCWAEMSLTRSMSIDESVRMLVEAANAVAGESSDPSDFPAYAAYHAVRGAVLTAESAAQLPMESFLEIVAASFGASRVLLASVPRLIHAQTVAALRADYDKLTQLGLGQGSERGAGVDPTVQGPLGELWVGKAPTW